MKNKPTLIILIVLLAILIPAVIIGLGGKFSHAKEEPMPELKYAKVGLDREDLYINAYKAGEQDTIEPFSVNGREYAFVDDEGTIYLYSIKDRANIVDYQTIKNYQTKMANNYLLVEREDKWGVLSLDTLKLVVPCEHDYLGLTNHFVNDKLDTSYFIVKDDQSYSIYQLTDGDFKKITNSYAKGIYDYNISQLLLVLNLDNEYGIYDFAGNRFFETYKIQAASLTDNHIVFVDENNAIYILDGLFSTPTIDLITTSWKKLDAKETDTELEIYIDDVLYKKIDI